MSSQTGEPSSHNMRLYSISSSVNIMTLLLRSRTSSMSSSGIFFHRSVQPTACGSHTGSDASRLTGWSQNAGTVDDRNLVRNACGTRAQKNGDTNAADYGWTLEDSLAPRSMRVHGAEAVGRRRVRRRSFGHAIGRRRVCFVGKCANAHALHAHRRSMKLSFFIELTWQISFSVRRHNGQGHFARRPPGARAAHIKRNVATTRCAVAVWVECRSAPGGYSYHPVGHDSVSECFVAGTKIVCSTAHFV